MKPERNVIVACTGSVASIKLPLLLKFLTGPDVPYKINVKVVTTEHAKHFFQAADLPNGVPVYEDCDEWTAWTKRGDPVLHIDLGKWADLLVIAPLSANSLAKIATGICDNLLLCVVRAWDIKKPLLFCPAMNTRMFDHPITTTQINQLRSWGYTEVPCIAKTLMCGDTGNGAMADVDTIAHLVLRTLGTLNIDK